MIRKLSSLLTALVALTILTACAGMQMGALSPERQLLNGYTVMTAYTRLVESSLDRGRLTADQGKRERARIDSVTTALDKADEALKLCTPAVPCTNFAQLMQQLQPALLEWERRLREEEAAKKK